ncbi:MAG: heme o synthase [Blastocatellia bacterium]
MEVLTSDNSINPAMTAEFVTAQPMGLREQIAAYLDLTKPRITFMVTLSSLAGFCLASRGGIDPALMVHTVIGIALLSSGIAALNQYLENDTDALMHRTRTRPLPTGRVSDAGALFFGMGLSIIATFYLALAVNQLTAAWGMAVFASYLFAYTPLKRISTWCTFIGAFPGALPPVLGWTAARNEAGAEALVLFAILFLWQFPHFHAIAMMYSADYRRADIKMLPVVEPDFKSTGQQIILYGVLLIPISVLPVWLGMAGFVYLAGALLLGAWYLKVGIDTARLRTPAQARKLLKASVMYLPLLLLLLVLNS